MKDPRLIIFLFLLMQAFVTTCLAQALKQQELRIFLTDSETQESVFGAEFSICSPDSGIGLMEYNHTISDMYKTTKYEVGIELVVVVSRSGYKPCKFRHVVKAEIGNNVKHVALEPMVNGPEKEYAIEGFLRYAKQTKSVAAPFEEVRLYGLREQVFDTTDEVGHFRFVFKETDMPAGKHSLNLLVGGEGNRYKLKDTTVVPKLDSKIIKITLEKNRKSFAINLRIRDPKAKTIVPYARVGIFDGGFQIGSAVADANGKVTITGDYDPSKGAYTMTIEGPGLPPITIRVPVNAMMGNPQFLEEQILKAYEKVPRPKIGQIGMSYGVDQTTSSGICSVELLAGLGDFPRILVGFAWRPANAREGYFNNLQFPVGISKVWQYPVELEAKYCLKPVLQDKGNAFAGLALSSQVIKVGGATQFALGYRCLVGARYNLIGRFGADMYLAYGRSKWMVPLQAKPISRGALTINVGFSYLFEW